MVRYVGLFSLLMLLVASTLFAADEQPEGEYSRETLRLMFRDFTYVPPPEPRLQVAVPGVRLGFRINPLLAFMPGPLGMRAGGSVMPVVDPFALLGVSYPQTTATFAERSFARKLRRETAAWLKAQRNASD